MIVSIFGQSGRRDTSVIASQSISIDLYLLEPPPFPSLPSILAGRVNQVKPTLGRPASYCCAMVIYCSGRPLLGCHDNYMISDCQCKGAELVLCSRAHGRNTRSFTWRAARRAGNRCRVVHVWVACVCVSPLPPCLCCTSRPRRRPAADPNLSAASPSVLHHPRQERHTNGLGRAHNVCFWVPGHLGNLVLHSASSH